MFSVKEKQKIAEVLEKTLLELNHPEMPKEKPFFKLHVKGKEEWSYADIEPNHTIKQPSYSVWNEIVSKLSKTRCFDKQGNPLTLEVCAKLLEDLDYKVIKKTIINKYIEVSTVWLGIEHGICLSGPLIFETMVFNNSMEAVQRRYSTEQQAIEGHDRIVSEIKVTG